MKIFITGANGYIGQSVRRLAHVEGRTITAGSRGIIPDEPNQVFYDLAANSIPAIPDDTEVVLHLAVDTSTQLGGEIELRAARLLLQAADTVGAKCIFISSQTARANAPTEYGRTKWRIEQEVLAAGGWVIRPGQVYGGKELGLFGILTNAVKKLPLLPAFWPVPQVQPIHVDDLAKGILNLASRQDIPCGLFSLAQSTPVSFTVFLAAIARYRLRTFRMFIPVPVCILQALGTLFKRNAAIHALFVRLNSLFDLPIMVTAEDLETLDLQLRPLASGMSRTQCLQRRELLEEGHALLSYILGSRPHSSLLRRYVRAIETMRGGSPLHLPGVTLVFPCTLALLEKRLLTPGEKDEEMAWRLHAAVVLGESSPQGAEILCKGGAIKSFASIMYAIIAEFTMRLVQLIAWPFLRGWKKQGETHHGR